MTDWAKNYACEDCGVRGEPSVQWNGGKCNDCKRKTAPICPKCNSRPRMEQIDDSWGPDYNMWCAHCHVNDLVRRNVELEGKLNGKLKPIPTACVVTIHIPCNDYKERQWAKEVADYAISQARARGRYFSLPFISAERTPDELLDLREVVESRTK